MLTSLAVGSGLVGGVLLGPSSPVGAARGAGEVTFPPPTPVTFTVEPGVPKFLVRCGHSHFGFDDPIVSPGQPGASHEHEFFGNTTTDAASTVQSLVNGTNLCGLTDDDSGYWFPAMYERGERLEADKISVYYQVRVEDEPLVQSFPEGFRMIAGDPHAAQPSDAVSFNCGPGTPEVPLPPSCAPGEFRALLDFPECSDGSTDSPDHRSHMAYRARGGCPSSHPIVLPMLRIIINYPSDGGRDVEFSSGGPTTFHGDFMSAWHPVTQDDLVADCLLAGVLCGEVLDAP